MYASSVSEKDPLHRIQWFSVQCFISYCFVFLAIALSDLLKFTTSDYSFGIDKLFLQEFDPRIQWGSCLVLYVCFVDRCLSFCTFSFWPLRCLFFFYLRILITSLWYLQTLLILLLLRDKKNKIIMMEMLGEGSF